jgi:hypothetical protein
MTANTARTLVTEWTWGQVLQQHRAPPPLPSDVGRKSAANPRSFIRAVQPPYLMTENGGEPPRMPPMVVQKVVKLQDRALIALSRRTGSARSTRRRHREAHAD